MNLKNVTYPRIEKFDLTEFVDEYLKSHVFVSSKNLACLFEGTPSGRRPTTGIVCQFGQTLRKFCESGKIYRYSTSQYRRTE